MRLKGSTAKQLSAFCEIGHNLCLEKLGKEVKRKKSNGLKQPNRRQVKKGQLRVRQRQLKRQLKDAPQQEKIGIQELLDDIKQNIFVLSRSENHRKRRKKKRKTRESFYRNPYAFPKKLVTAAKSGRLDIPQGELEDHIRKTYSDPLREVPLPLMDGIPPLEEPETPGQVGSGCMRPASLFTKRAPAVPQDWMVSPSSSTRTAQLSWNSSSTFYKEPGGKDTSHKNGAWLMGSGYPMRRIPLEWAPFAQSLSSTSKARSSCNRQANDIIPPPEQVHQYVSPEGWHLRVPWLPGACLNDLEFVGHSKAWEERTPRRMAWHGQCLWISASQLHQVSIEVLPHPRESDWHLNAVFRECFPAFQLQLQLQKA